MAHSMTMVRGAGAVTPRRQAGSSSSVRGRAACAVRARASAEPRPVQIIPSVLPADWANMGQYVHGAPAAVHARTASRPLARAD